MKPNRINIGDWVMVSFGRTSASPGTRVRAKIVGVTPKRVRVQREFEKGIFIKKWSEIS